MNKVKKEAKRVLTIVITNFFNKPKLNFTSFIKIKSRLELSYRVSSSPPFFSWLDLILLAIFATFIKMHQVRVSRWEK